MIIRQSKMDDTQNILDLMIEAYSQSRYNTKYAIQWINCFINNSLVFPSYVAVSEDNNIQGYIVWKVRQLSKDRQMTLELLEMAAHKGAIKLAVERLLFDESPQRIVNSLLENEFEVGKTCNLDIWIHHEDQQRNKSILYDNEKRYSKFLGGFEKSDARGELLLLYRQEYEIPKIKKDS